MLTHMQKKFFLSFEKADHAYSLYYVPSGGFRDLEP